MKNIIAGLFAIIFVISCKKKNIEPQPVASLNVTTAVIGGSSVKLNNNLRDSVLAYNSRSFGIVPGNDITLFPTNSPSTIYYQSLKPATQSGKLYSVFLAGQSPNFEAIFREESFPNRYSDSIFGVRIINLSPNSTPMNITLQNNTTTNVFSNVTYKQLTDFVTFPLPTTIPAGSVSFQVRAAATPGTVLATYTLPNSVVNTYPGISVSLQRFKNITLVIKGLQGTTGSNPDAFGLFPVVTSY